MGFDSIKLERMKTNIQSNAWRIKYAVILLSLIGCLVSCKSKESEPEQPTPPSQSPLTEKAKDVATFLTDNYAVGDSVFFRRETGETEGFVVRWSLLTEICGALDPENGISEDFAYDVSTYLESKNNFIVVDLNVYDTWPGDIEIKSQLYINRDDNHSSTTMTIIGDTILLSSQDRSCTLLKNVGLVHVQLNGSTWDLIQ
jgi:hypothetical protein